MKLIKILLPLIVPAALLSCKKSATSNAGIEYQVAVSNPTAVISRVSTAGSITWTSGSAFASETKLEGKSNNTEVEFKNQTGQKIDLFAAIASLGNIVLPPGNYTEVEFKIELNPNANDPALVLNGQFINSSGNVTPVTFLVNTLLEIKEEQTNVTITDNTSTIALTTIDLSLLTNGITQSMLNSATVTNGTIVISSSTNTALYNIIINNFNQSHHVEVHHH